MLAEARVVPGGSASGCNVVSGQRWFGRARRHLRPTSGIKLLEDATGRVEFQVSRLLIGRQRDDYLGFAQRRPMDYPAPACNEVLGIAYSLKGEIVHK